MAYIHKHTEGDWDFIEFPDKSNCFVKAPRKNLNDPYDIEILGDDWNDELYPYKQKVADGKLTAQAPKLLQIAEMYLDQLERDGKAQTIIAKTIRQTIVDAGVKIT